PVLIEVGENAHYQPNPGLLAEAGDLAGLIVASPANPTGTMIPAAALERLSEYCRERQIRLVSDEIYHGITYEETPQTARAFGAGRGRVLYLCRCVVTDPRQRRILSVHARRDRRRGNPGARFRSAPRRQLDPPLLRRLDRGHRRSLPPPLPLAPTGWIKTKEN